jgi:hypothetical protein
MAFPQIFKHFSEPSLTLTLEFSGTALIQTLSLIRQPISPESGHSERTQVALR